MPINYYIYYYTNLHKFDKLNIYNVLIISKKIPLSSRLFCYKSWFDNLKLFNALARWYKIVKMVLVCVKIVYD